MNAFKIPENHCMQGERNARVTTDTGLSASGITIAPSKDRLTIEAMQALLASQIDMRNRFARKGKR